MRINSGHVSMLSNTLLASLPQAEWDVLHRDMRRNYLVSGQYLHQRGHTPEQAYFLEEGLASLVIENPSGRRSVQVAMVGREGLVSGLSLLGSGPAPTDATMQFAGTALCLPMAVLVQRVAELPTLRQLCLAYVQDLVTQVMETSADSVQQTLVQRCGRWVLMAQDRMGTEDLLVTHDTLAGLLGVRRPGVTLAMAVLHDEGLIRASRGRIRVMQRAGLEAVCAGASRPDAPLTHAG